LLALASFTPVQAGHLRRDLWFFSNSTAAPRAIGESCSENNPCQEGLSCTTAPSCVGLLASRQVCFPVDCLSNAIMDLNDQVNLTEYRDFVFTKASVTPEEFFMTNEMSRSNDILNRYQRVQAMRQSTKVHRVMQTIKENPISEDIWDTYLDALGACDPENKLSSKNSFGWGPSAPGIMGTVGLGLDVGAV
jgi:hypothetical protein